VGDNIIMTFVILSKFLSIFDVISKEPEVLLETAYSRYFFAKIPTVPTSEINMAESGYISS
jgi:hypothetical protein